MAERGPVARGLSDSHIHPLGMMAQTACRLLLLSTDPTGILAFCFLLYICLKCSATPRHA